MQIRFELMASTRATRIRTRGCSQIRAHGVNQGNQVLGMLIDSSSWRQPVGNQVLGDDHGGNQVLGMQTDSSSQVGNKDLGDAVRFELMASTRAPGMQIDSSSWRQPGQGEVFDRSLTRWILATRPGDADRFELTYQVDPQSGPGMQSDSSSWRQPGPGMQIDSSSWRQPVAPGERSSIAHLPGGSTTRARGMITGAIKIWGMQIRFELMASTRARDADRFELMASTRATRPGMQTDSSSWRQPGRGCR